MRACLRAVIFGAAVAMGALGCTARPHPPQAPHASGPLPRPSEIAAAYNRRVADIRSLKAPATLLLDTPDGKGGRKRDQVEAALSVVLPGDVAMSVNKVGQVLFVMGCAGGRYWWLDLGEEPRAFAGDVALASPEKVGEFGVPVHPLDLLEVLAITPLPEPTEVGWSEDAKSVVVRVPGRWGSRKFWLAPSTWEPTRIELLDASGRVAVAAALSRYAPVRIDGKFFSPARMPTQVEVEVPQRDFLATVAIAAPADPGERMKRAVFDLATVLRTYGIDTATDIDAPEKAR